MDKGFVNVSLYADGDDTDNDEANDHSALDVVRYEGDTETTQRGVDRGDGTFDDHSREAVETGQGVDDLLEG